MNEAMRQNRRERNEAEKKMKEKGEKEKELRDRRNKARLLMKKKKEEQKKEEEKKGKYIAEMNQMRDGFIKEYLEKNEGHNYSQAHKEFNRSIHKQLERGRRAMEMLQSFGMDSDMTEEHLCKMVEDRKKEVNCEEIGWCSFFVCKIYKSVCFGFPNSGPSRLRLKYRNSSYKKY